MVRSSSGGCCNACSRYVTFENKCSRQPCPDKYMPAARSFESLKGDLSRLYPGLSPQLQAIANYALENPQDMALDTVARLAKGAGVQPSALVRFAQARGYGGFSDLPRIFRTRVVRRASGYPA